MEQQMQQALVELINLITSGAEGLYAFGQEQIPELLTQLIIWKTVLYGAEATIFLSVALAAIWWMCSVKNSPPESGYRDYSGGIGEGYLMLVFLMVVVTIFMAVLTLMSLSNLLQITLAPKVWLIEYAADLTNGGSK